MDRREYFDIEGFEGVYLEDSYVLGITEDRNSIEFDIDVVLTQSHPQYRKPKRDEQYCYRRAKIIFSRVREIEWKERRMEKFTDAKGQIDYGNIDELYSEDGIYSVAGDWGEVKIISSRPELRLF